MRQFGRPTTLDLRFTIQPFNRTGCALASVFAYQEGLPPFKGSEWRRIGAVAAREESQLPIAVARQRELIETWACCLVTDFRTVRAGLGILRPLAASPALPRLARAHAHSQRSCDRVRYVCQGKKLMTRRKPIKLAWALPPRFGQISWPSGYLNEVHMPAAGLKHSACAALPMSMLSHTTLNDTCHVLLEQVPAKTPRDDSVRCGFFGDNVRCGRWRVP